MKQMACCHGDLFKVKVSKMGVATFISSFMMKYWQHLTKKGRYIPADEVYFTLTILAPLYQVHYIGLPERYLYMQVGTPKMFCETITKDGVLKRHKV